MPRRSTESCACSRLRRATRALTQLYDDALLPADLRVTQFVLLKTLARRGPMTISALAATLLLDRTALSRNLDPLAARKLVVVAKGSDARTREAQLTTAGRRALAAAEPHWVNAQARVAESVGAQRLQSLYDVLDDLERLHPALAAAALEDSA